MKPGIIPESVDDHDHAQYPIIEAQHRAKEEIEAFFGAVAQLGQELAVVFEINAQHDGDTEYKLSVRDGIEDVVCDVLCELNLKRAPVSRISARFTCSRNHATKRQPEQG